MTNEQPAMKSWRIEFIKSKRSQPKHVYTYTKSLMILILILAGAIIGLGINRVLNETNIFGIALLVIGGAAPFPFLYVGLTAKGKLKKIIKEGYYPKTPIDVDRYAITVEYYKIDERVNENKLGDGPTFMSDFQTKQVFHEKKKMFSSIKKKK